MKDEFKSLNTNVYQKTYIKKSTPEKKYMLSLTLLRKMDDYRSVRLPAIDQKCNNQEDIFYHKERYTTESKSSLKEKSKEKINVRKRASKLTLDVLTPAKELPLGLAVALAKDVIRIERYNREQKLLDEIRKNRNHYQSLKRQITSGKSDFRM